MKRLCGIWLSLWMCLCIGALPAHAAEVTYEDTLASLLALEEGEVSFLPEEPDLSDPAALTQEGVQGIAANVVTLFREELMAPLRMLPLLLGVILLAALGGAFRQGGETGAVYECICTLCAVGLTAQPLLDGFGRAGAMLERTGSFLLAFTGIYGTVTAAGGAVSTAALWQGSMIPLCEGMMLLAAKVLLPLLSMSLAMSIVDAVHPEVSLTGLIGMIHKVTAWGLGLLMAGFSGLLTVQSMVTASADRAGTKAAKFVISGAVPIVGGAVSDAYAAVIGSMRILRSGVGMTGILMLLSLLLPAVISLGLYRGFVMLAAALSELFDVPVLTRLFRNFGTVLATGFSVAVCFLVVSVFSVAALLHE